MSYKSGSPKVRKTVAKKKEMIINRHNYEEYFILYMDNELSSEDRGMVEAFVQQHPDLKEELDLLMQFKLQPDQSISFNGKEELLKVNGETPITVHNYEEWLVAYIDNELSAERAAELKSLMNKHSFIQDEFVLLQKAKLQPEIIQFPDKESLYRRDEERRIVPFPYKWIAAAVLVIALGISAVLVINNRSKSVPGNDGVVKTNPNTEIQSVPANNVQSTKEDNENLANVPAVDNKKNETENIIANNDPAPENKVINKPSNQQVLSNRDEIKLANNIKNKTAPELVNPTNNNPVTLKKNEEAIVENKIKPSNNLPEPTNNRNIIENNPTTNTVAKVKDPNNNPLTNPEVTNPYSESSNKSNPDIKTASLTELEEGSNNKKSRGLFRKIARTFEKRTNLTATDDNRLLVAGLSFKLK